MVAQLAFQIGHCTLMMAQRQFLAQVAQQATIHLSRVHTPFLNQAVLMVILQAIGYASAVAKTGMISPLIGATLWFVRLQTMISSHNFWLPRLLLTTTAELR